MMSGTGFDAVPLPKWIAGESDVRADVARWITSPPLAALVEAWGSKIPAELPTAGLLEWLDDFTENHWDFRRGVERNFVTHQSDERDELVLDAARALGLVGTTRPQGTNFTHIVVLGGLVRACLARPIYAAQLVGTGVTAGDVSALGGHRELSGDEHQLAARAGFGHVRDEIQALTEGLKSAFAVERDPVGERGADSSSANSRWVNLSFQTTGVPLRVVAAPSSEPEIRRANTPDTYKWWAEKVVRLKPGDSVLLVTNDIYVPFQGAGAIRMLALPFGANVETVGYATDDIPNAELHQAFTPSNYLQEIRSTIRAFADLHRAATQ